MKRFILSIFALMMIAAPAAYACHHDGGAMMKCEKCNKCEKCDDCKKQTKDANGDGVISKDEYMQYSENKFMNVDTDKNGVISKDEAHAANKKKRMKNAGWKKNKSYKSTAITPSSAAYNN